MSNQFARYLRKNLTDAERRLWKELRYRQLDGHKFRRQAPIGRYIADFVNFECKLIVELDGGQHLTDAEAYRRDRRKDAALQEHGYFVLRFLCEDLSKRLDDVLDAILRIQSRRKRAL